MIQTYIGPFVYILNVVNTAVLDAGDYMPELASQLS